MDYYCDLCGERCSMMGHWKQDADGSYYVCQEPERHERALAKWKADHEARERAELARLQAKYPD